MFKMFVITRKQLTLVLVVTLFILAAATFITVMNKKDSFSANGQPAQEQVFQLVTGEFESRTADGKKIEAYGWHPGSITVQKGVPVKLEITGISGNNHPFIIEGLGVKGEIKKGETTTVQFTAEHAGTYRLLCLSHDNLNHGGPMVGYIFVQ